MSSRYAAAWFPVLILLSPAAVCPGQEPAADDAKASAKAWQAARQAEFEAYSIAFADEPSVKLKLEPGSLLNWSNAERGGDVGALMLWTHEGQPELIACAYGRDQRLRHEFHSLSARPISTALEGALVHRFQPGIEWHEFREASAPAPQRALRLAQMRRLAERFRVTIGEREQSEMRLLRQPIYRTAEDAKTDTALFLFVQGTDPECVLTLEATEEKKWRYALTRQTKMPVQISLDGTPVLEIEAFWLQPRTDDSPFYVLIPATAGQGPRAE
jgi:hypothetical protein